MAYYQTEVMGFPQLFSLLSRAKRNLKCNLQGRGEFVKSPSSEETKFCFSECLVDSKVRVRLG